MVQVYVEPIREIFFFFFKFDASAILKILSLHTIPPKKIPSFTEVILFLSFHTPQEIVNVVLHSMINFTKGLMEHREHKNNKINLSFKSVNQ